MPTTHLEVISAERLVYEDDVDMVIAPGADGVLGILPRHAHIITLLQAGELRAKKGAEEVSLAVTGGFLQVYPDRVVVLADAAERAEEIDIARAETARKKAEQRLRESKEFKGVEIDLARAEAAMRRSLTRLKVAERYQRRREGRRGP